MQGNISQSLIGELSQQIKREPLAKPLEVRDTGLKGFIVRVQPSGVMSYVVQIARGKRLTVGKVPVTTAKRAREKARIALGAAAEGRDPKEALRVDEGSTAPTLRAYVENKYAGWITANRKTGAELVARLKACFFADFGETPLDQVTAWKVEKWRKARLEQGRAVGTINRDLSTLKAALARAVEWELIDRNPLTAVKPGKEDRFGVVRYLSPAEEHRLRSALVRRDAKLRAGRERGNAWRRERGRETMPDVGAYGDHLTPLVLVSLNTGIRQGEAFNLRWSDVDTDRGSLVIRGDGTKSGTTRHIPLNAEARAVLKTWRKQSDQVAGSDYVFPGRNGGRLDNVKKSWSALLRSAGVDGFRWHDQRHHFASRLVMAGVDLNTVRELLGHSDLKMTLRYAHLAPEHKAAAVEKLVAATVAPIRAEVEA